VVKNAPNARNELDKVVIVGWNYKVEVWGIRPQTQTEFRERIPDADAILTAFFSKIHVLSII